MRQLEDHNPAPALTTTHPAPTRLPACAPQPYVQESVWRRLGKTVDIMVGSTSMRKFPHDALRTR